MKAIYKYPILVQDYQTITMPKGATILSVQNQNGYLQMWAIVDIDCQEIETRIFRMIGTGNPFIDTDMTMYIDTVQHDGYVWHIFEETIK